MSDETLPDESEAQPTKRELWEGGYVRRTKAGRDIYIIERWVNGTHYHKSTRCSRRDAAIKQLIRFEADPGAYDARGPTGTKPKEDVPLVLTGDLVIRFRAYQIDEKGNTPKHANNMASVLADWVEDLAGTDLRHVTLRQLRAALDTRKTSTKKRIIAIKSFYSWLRKVRGLLTSGQDATLDLPVPQGRPEKWERKKVVESADVQAVMQKISNERIRDALFLLSATGWHVTELQRFARRGELIEHGRDGVIAVLVTQHKGGEMTRTPLQHQTHVDCARRILERRAIPNPSDINVELKEAATRAKVEPFGAGVLRHSVLTWAVQAGADVAKVSEFAGHKDPRTTRRFYVDVHVPTNVIPLPALRPSKRMA
jgi:integrase